MQSDELHAKITALHNPIHKAYCAIGAMQKALGLPFLPVPLQPISEMFHLANEICGAIKSLETENERLKAELETLRTVHAD